MTTATNGGRMRPLLRPATQRRLADQRQYFIRHGTPDVAGAMTAIGDIVCAQATFMGYANCLALFGCRAGPRSWRCRHA
jgi:hypothetical protein